ncbi:MAG: O-antigen ligase family protein [Opitutaceae bacterium]|nr:O-antigen ligase family protein [Opitutaceae bacterium]
MSIHATRNELKYAPGVGSRISTDAKPLSALEQVTLIHVGVFALAATWAFGGNADWVQVPLAWWGSIGALITLTAIQDRVVHRRGSLRILKWFWPIAAFNALVCAGTLNPSFREMAFDTDVMLVNVGARAGWPSSARPAAALHRLWVFDATWITCFNLAFAIRQRRALRGLLLVLVANGLALAIFGTLQKFSGAKGLFFDAVASPQRYFFATFIYHNHWGAFMVLMIAMCLGLTWHYARRIKSRDMFHSPVFAAVVVILLLAATVPLSTSRSCSVLVALLLAAAFLNWIFELIRKRRHFHESIALPVAGAIAAALLLLAGVWFVARESIISRTAVTRNQIADMQARGSVGARSILYADTWQMAKDKLWFGWGMGSYPHVFTHYNSQTSVDRLPVFYHDAHSDWLQALAEHGLVGTLLLGAMAIVPLLGIQRRYLTSAIPRYVLTGCGLLVLYAWIEFPFGNMAVVLFWWLGFFCSVQYARLHEHESSVESKATPSAGAALT